MKDINIISWNVNGLRAIYKKGFSEWVRTEKPDILCLQETKAREEQLTPSMRHIDDYRAYFSMPERKGYSGVAIYTRIEPEEVRYGFGIEKFDREGRAIIAEFEEFTLFNIYFPNGKASQERLDYKMEFYDSFLEYADQLKEQGKHIVVCGDFNTAHKEIDLARPKQNEKRSGFLPLERAWIDKLISHGYVDTLRQFDKESGKYTWWDLKTRARERNVGWRIDYFFASEEFTDKLKSAYILPEVMGSDHCPIGLKIYVPR